jgi:hypothetical protein
MGMTPFATYISPKASYTYLDTSHNRGYPRAISGRVELAARLSRGGLGSFGYFA